MWKATNESRPLIDALDKYPGSAGMLTQWNRYLLPSITVVAIAASIHVSGHVRGNRRLFGTKQFFAINPNKLEKIMRALTASEVQEVSGGSKAEQMQIERHKLDGAGTIALTVGIGVATFGSGWGALAVGTAFATAPVAVVAMAGLAAYAGYRFWRR